MSDFGDWYEHLRKCEQALTRNDLPSALDSMDKCIDSPAPDLLLRLLKCERALIAGKLPRAPWRTRKTSVKLELANRAIEAALK